MLWAGKHVADGLGRRLRLAARSADHARASAKASPFPAASKIIARHVAARTARHRQCRGGGRASRLAGGRHARRRADRRLAGAGGRCSSSSGCVTLLWLVPWQQAVARACRPPAICDEGAARSARASCSRKWPLWSMSIVHALGNYCFYFILTWLPLYLTKSRGFTHRRNDAARHARLCGPGRCARSATAIFRTGGRARADRGRVPPLDDGRQPAACRGVAILGLAFADRRGRRSASCCASPARPRRRCRSISTPSRRCSPARAHRAPGSASRMRSAIVSGIVGADHHRHHRCSVRATTAPSC